MKKPRVGPKALLAALCASLLASPDTPASEAEAEIVTVRPDASVMSKQRLLRSASKRPQPEAEQQRQTQHREQQGGRRLVQIKKRYDPTNLFRLNANVAPTV